MTVQLCSLKNTNFVVLLVGIAGFYGPAYAAATALTYVGQAAKEKGAVAQAMQAAQAIATTVDRETELQSAATIIAKLVPDLRKCVLSQCGDLPWMYNSLQRVDVLPVRARSIMWTRGARYLSCCTADNEVRRYDFINRTYKTYPNAKSAYMNSEGGLILSAQEVVFSPNGRYLAKILDRSIEIYECSEDGRTLWYVLDPVNSGQSLLQGQLYSIRGLAWSPDSRHLAYAVNVIDTNLNRTLDKGYIYVCDVLEKRPKEYWREAFRIHVGPYWSSDGQNFACLLEHTKQSRESVIVEYRGNSFCRNATYLPHYFMAKDFRWVPNCQDLLVGDNFGSLLIVNPERRLVKKIIPGNGCGSLTSLAWEPGGDVFACGYGSGTINLYTGNLELLHTPTERTGRVDVLSWLGNTLVSFSRDGYIHIWKPRIKTSAIYKRVLKSIAQKAQQESEHDESHVTTVPPTAATAGQSSETRST